MLGQMLSHILADLEPVCWDRTELDITDETAVKEKIKKVSPQVIINAAAYTDVDGAENQLAVAQAVNGRGVRHLAVAAKAGGARLVHFSTDYVFSGEKAEGYREDDQPGLPVNAYGVSKLAGEESLHEIAPAFYLIRTAWLYGPGGKNFVDTMLALGKKQAEIAVVNDQYGSPTFTADVARVTRQLLLESFPPGIYHAVNAGQTTWYGLAKEIFSCSKMTVRVTPVSSDQFPRPAKRPRYSRLLNTKGLLLRPWQKALQEYIEGRTIYP